MSYKKIIFVLSFLAVFGFMFNFGLPEAKAMTVAEIQVLITQLQQQIAQLQKQLAEIQEKPVVWCHDFNVNLKYGDSGNEVNLLQLALDKEGLYISPTDRGGYFGEYTASAVVGFQEKYKEEVLSPWGLEHGTGYVGPTTRAKLNELYGCGVVPPSVKPYIQVLSPNGGEKWVRGNTYKITWSMEGIESVNVEYIKKGPEEFDVYYVISSNLYKGEAFYWDIPLDFPTGEYKIVVVEVVPSGGYATIDYSDNYFSIVEGGLGLKYIEIQLASLSEAVLQLAEKIKLLMRR